MILMLKVLFIVLFLFFVGLVFWIFPYFFKNEKSNNNLANITDKQIIESHPQLYFAKFTYYKNSNRFVFNGSGTTKGDVPFYNTDKPSTSGGTLNIKISQVSKDNLLINEGWSTLFLQALQKPSDPKDEYRFNIYIRYLPGSIVYLSDQSEKIVWVGQIE